jgi:hypothetical protein
MEQLPQTEIKPHTTVNEAEQTDDILKNPDLRFELIDKGAGHTAVNGLVTTAPWYA